jgi:FtsP/CotA-like multicopper oxidase with cupredoxin domain
MKNQLKATIIQAAIVGLLGGGAAAPAVKPDDIPPSLRVTTNAVVALKAHASGVQIYRCRAAKDDAARFEWTFKEPEADLSDPAGNRIGKHYAGPTWEAKDGSKVTGEVVAQAKSPDSNSVAWLLLRAKATSGNGVFAGVRFVQRLHTVGGNAPSDGCDQASAEKEVRVPYSADYWFYGDKS